MGTEVVNQAYLCMWCDFAWGPRGA